MHNYGDQVEDQSQRLHRRSQDYDDDDENDVDNGHDEDDDNGDDYDNFDVGKDYGNSIVDEYDGNYDELQYDQPSKKRRQIFTGVASDAASVGQWTRLQEHVVESVATEQTKEEWHLKKVGSKSAMAIQSSLSNIFMEAAAIGQLKGQQRSGGKRTSTYGANDPEFLRQQLLQYDSDSEDENDTKEKWNFFQASRNNNSADDMEDYHRLDDTHVANVGNLQTIIQGSSNVHDGGHIGNGSNGNSNYNNRRPARIHRASLMVEGFIQQQRKLKTTQLKSSQQTALEKFDFIQSQMEQLEQHQLNVIQEHERQLRQASLQIQLQQQEQQSQTDSEELNQQQGRQRSPRHQRSLLQGRHGG